MIRAFKDCYSIANLTNPKIAGYGDLRNSSPSRKYWFNGDFGIKVITSVSMNISRPGYMLLIFSGYAVLNSSDRLLDIGIGTSRNSIRDPAVVETARFYCREDSSHRIPYAVSAVIPVFTGRITFYGLARGRQEYRTGDALVYSEGISCTFISGG